MGTHAPPAAPATDHALRVLVVEDAPEFVALIRAALDTADIAVATDGERGVELARTLAPEVIILDLSLPKLDGIESCRRIREFSDAYVIMLTARDSETDRVVGLSVGADDYIVKPFYPGELRARVQAMLRRPRAGAAREAAPDVRRFDDLEVDPQAREVRVAGESVELSRTEFDILDALSSEPNVALSRAQLLDRVWGPGWFGDDHVIDVHLSNLRRKLGDDPRRPRYIRNVRGYGYRMA